MIREQGEDARVGVIDSGIHAFVSITEVNKGIWRYTIAKSSPFIDFPIEDLYSLLNKSDVVTTLENEWGGSDLIGGSPRNTGSELSPNQVFEIIEEHMQNNAKQ